MATSDSRTITLGFIGDLMIGRKVEGALECHDPAWFWGDVLPILQDTDAVIANLECPITTRDRRWPWPKTWYFRADPKALAILQAGNVRFVNLANNHMLDYRAEGLLDTLTYLNKAGIACAGAGEDPASARAGTLLRLPAMTLGLVACTDNKPSFAVSAAQPGTHYRRIDDNADFNLWVADQSRALRDQGAEAVILSVHWGPNMRLRPPARFRACARTLLADGVDVIHGHSAHVFQAVERCAGGVVLYDTGNFLDDYWKFPFRETLWTFVFLVDFRAGRPRRLRLKPVKIEPLSVRLATGREFDRMCDRMLALCADTQTALVREPDGLSLDLRDAA